MIWLLILLLAAAVGAAVFAARQGKPGALPAALVLLVLLAVAGGRAAFRSPDRVHARQTLDSYHAVGVGLGELAREVRRGDGPVVLVDLPPDGSPFAADARARRRRGVEEGLGRIPLVDLDRTGLSPGIWVDVAEDEFPRALMAHVWERHPDAGAIVSVVGAPPNLPRREIPLVAYPAPPEADVRARLLGQGGVAALVSHAPPSRDGPEPLAPIRDPRDFFRSRYIVERSPHWPGASGDTP